MTGLPQVANLSNFKSFVHLQYSQGGSLGCSSVGCIWTPSSQEEGVEVGALLPRPPLPAPMAADWGCWDHRHILEL